MTTPIDVILRFVKTGQGAEQARAALKGLGDSANRADIEMSAMGATAQASQRKLQQLGDEVARGKKSVEQATREWKEYQGAISSGNIPRETSNLKSFATGALAVGAALGTAAIAAREAYQFIGEGAELEAARGRFENLTGTIGTTADALLMKMQAATKGMVSDAKLIAGASDIISLGLAKNEDDTVRLATAVSTLGLDMQQVILTFANNSKARLDSLGLSVEGVTRKAAELEAQGFTGDAFDEAVIQGLEEKMELLGDASETTAGQMQILETSWENLTDSLKRQGANLFAPTISQAAGTVNAFERLGTALKNGDISLVQYGLAMDLIIAKGADSEAVLDTFGVTTAEVGKATSNTAEDVEKMVAEAEALRAQLVATEAAQADVALTTYAVGGAYNQAAQAAGSWDRALLQNYTNIQAANNAEIRWNQAMENSKDLLAESKQVAAAAAAARAKLAAATGDLFTQFSEADGALKFFNESLDELGQQYVAVGGRTAEQSADLDRLQGAYDKAEQTIRDYELGIKGANLSDEARADKIAEQQQAMANLAANMQPLLGIQSELVSVNNALSVNQDAVNSAMYAAADAAGADAAQLAILKVATGELSPVQAEAVIKSVALEQTLKNLGQAYADGDLTLQDYITAAQQAVTDINGMTVSFDTQTGAITTSNDAAADLIDTLDRLPTHHDFVIKITTDGALPTLPTGPGSSQRVAANAEGGPITGGMPYTGPGPDNVIIGAQTGEYMLKRSAVQKLGLNRLNYMNSTGRLPGYAEGGVIGSDSGGGSLSGASIMFQPVIQVTGVVSRQQGLESGRNIVNGLEQALQAAQGRGVRI